MTEILAEFQNKEDGMKATIAKYHRGGFSVVLWDTDAGEAVPCVTIYQTLDAAIIKAKKIANVI